MGGRGKEGRRDEGRGRERLGEIEIETNRQSKRRRSQAKVSFWACYCFSQVLDLHCISMNSNKS